MDRRYAEAETAQVAQELLTFLQVRSPKVRVVALEGDLGAGKTTLTKEIARLLGVPVEVTSPTFVVARWYETNDELWHRLVHIDAYRLESTAELTQINWQTIVRDPNTLVIVEWPERIRDALPPSTMWVRIEHHGDERHITTL